MVLNNCISQDTLYISDYYLEELENLRTTMPNSGIQYLSRVGD